MVSLSPALLVGCAVGEYSPEDDHETTDRDWYDSRQDEIGCMGDAVRSGLFPGDEYDSYVSNCMYDRESEPDEQR